MKKFINYAMIIAAIAMLNQNAINGVMTPPANWGAYYNPVALDAIKKGDLTTLTSIVNSDPSITNKLISNYVPGSLFPYYIGTLSHYASGLGVWDATFPQAQTSIVTYLKTQNPDLTIKDSLGRTPGYYANYKYLPNLITPGFDNALLNAIYNSDLSQVTMLIEAYPENINKQISYTVTGTYTGTPLHYAYGPSTMNNLGGGTGMEYFKYDQEPIIKYLESKGADLNIVDNLGHKPNEAIRSDKKLIV